MAPRLRRWHRRAAAPMTMTRESASLSVAGRSGGVGARHGDHPLPGPCRPLLGLAGAAPRATGTGTARARRRTPSFLLSRAISSLQQRARWKCARCEQGGAGRALSALGWDAFGAHSPPALPQPLVWNEFPGTFLPPKVGDRVMLSYFDVSTLLPAQPKQPECVVGPAASCDGDTLSQPLVSRSFSFPVSLSLSSLCLATSFPRLRCAPAEPFESMACMDHVAGIRDRHEANLNDLYTAEVRWSQNWRRGFLPPLPGRLTSLPCRSLCRRGSPTLPAT